MIGVFNLLLIAVFILLETIEHCLYRVGSASRAAWRFTIAGMGINVVGMCLWLIVLRTARLGQVLPLLAATNVLVAFAGLYLFKERITPRRWCGIVLITIGVALVSSVLL